jgi:hypothetical protein
MGVYSHPKIYRKENREPAIWMHASMYSSGDIHRLFWHCVCVCMCVCVCVCVCVCMCVCVCFLCVFVVCVFFFFFLQRKDCKYWVLVEDRFTAHLLIICIIDWVFSQGNIFCHLQDLLLPDARSLEGDSLYKVSVPRVHGLPDEESLACCCPATGTENLLNFGLKVIRECEKKKKENI